MNETKKIEPGDIVVHPKRPEWGDGKVRTATRSVVGGKVGQRLTVSFANHGIATINTAVVPLVPKELVQNMSTAQSKEQGWLAQLEQKSKAGTATGSHLAQLPDSFSDPFKSLSARIAIVLESYRYGGKQPTQRGLLEWAISQTGDNDPLSNHSRHELEQAYDIYARDRGRHLLDLIKQMKQQNKLGEVKELVNHPRVLADAKQAINDALRML